MRRPRGFTLIEIMIVLATIGLLSSVAMPTFRSYQLRSRAAERAVITRQIDNAMLDYFAREGRFPNDGGFGFSWMWLPQNPPGAVSPQKRAFQQTLGDWRRLSLLIDGHVYYQYMGWASMNGAVRNDWIQSTADLDGDGDQPWYTDQRQYQGTQLQWEWHDVNCNNWPNCQQAF